MGASRYMGVDMGNGNYDCESEVLRKSKVAFEWTFQFATDYGIPYDHDIRVLVVDRSGMITFRHRGNMTDKSLVEVITTIDAQLATKPAKPKPKVQPKPTENTPPKSVN